MANLVSRFGLTRYDADEYYRIALNHYKKRNLEEAIHSIDQALALLPTRAEYYATRGFFRLEDGVPIKAAEDFEMALRHNPYEMLANYGKGVIAYQDKDWEGAQQYFLTAWAAMPDRAETLYYLSLVAHRLGENERALDWMQRARDAFDKRSEKRPVSDADEWLRELRRLVSRDILFREKQLDTGTQPDTEADQ